MSSTVSTSRRPVGTRGFLDSEETQLLSVSWNQDCSCLAAGTNHDFRIYTTEPFKETIKRNHMGGFQVVGMLFKTNIFALVGCGDNPFYPRTKVLVWDDHLGQPYCELAFRSQVLAVKLREDSITVVLETKIYVYNFGDLRVLRQVETAPNPRGLCCVSQRVNTNVLACPDLRRGWVRVEDIARNTIKKIEAHESDIACIAMALDGRILATASTKGTLIRIFNAVDGGHLLEVRRGIDRADIHSIAFSLDLQWMVMSSDRGTVHVFSLGVLGRSLSEALQTQDATSSCSAHSVPSRTQKNPRSSLSYIKGILPAYLSSEWSFAQFRVPQSTRFIAALGSQNTLMIVGMDGSFYRCRFDPVCGGQMSELEHLQFLPAR